MAPSHSTSKRKTVLPLHIDTASFLNPAPQHKTSTLGTLANFLFHPITTWRRGSHKRQVAVLIILLLMSLGWNFLQYQANSWRYIIKSDSGEINDPLPSAPLIHHQHAIVVTGHAMYVGPEDNKLATLQDENHWILESYQHGQVDTYLRHIQKGIDMLLSDPQSLLIFSGGQTRPSAGPLSEGFSYWQVAQTLLKHQKEDTIHLLQKRMIVEDYARDSYENVLFSLCRFAEMTNEYPIKLTVIGFEFKRARFEQLHIKSIRYPFERFDYIGIDPPSFNKNLSESELVNSYTPFLADLYGCHGALRQKKLDRNPYRRRSPYRSTCPILAPLLDYCPSKNMIFNGPLPWST